MTRIASRVDAGSAGVPRQRGAHAAPRRRVAQRQALAAAGGGEDARAKHVARGKLLPRERIEALLDPGSPFLEIAPLAAGGMYGDDAPARRASSPASAASMAASCSWSRTTRPSRAAPTTRSPSRSTCARRKSRSRTACPASTSSIRAAPSCRCRTRCSRTASTSAASSSTRRGSRPPGIPQVAVVMGSCTAGGAYVPAMCDESIIVRNQGTIFLGGPPLVKAATGEVVDAEIARRRRRARAHLRRRRSSRGQRRARARDGARDRRQPQSPPAVLARRREAALPAQDAAGALRHRAARPAPALRRARGDRAPRRRLRVPRVQGAVRQDAGLRLRAHLGLSGRDPRQQRHPVLGVGAEGRALRAAREPRARCRSCSCRTSPASWSASATRRAASRATARRW